MTKLIDELKEWAGEIRDIQLPRWDELPDFGLYMDQVLIYINGKISFLGIEEIESEKDSENLLTASMINNYVKNLLIPKPNKKKYYRPHLASLLIYSILKSVLPLKHIQLGIYLQASVQQKNYKEAYNIFCQQFEKSVSYITDISIGNEVDSDFIIKIPEDILGTHMATISLISKLFSEKVLSLNKKTVDNKTVTEWFKEGINNE